jgi:hypothetical protein
MASFSAIEKKNRRKEKKRKKKSRRRRQSERSKTALKPNSHTYMYIHILNVSIRKSNYIVMYQGIYKQTLQARRCRLDAAG